MYIDIIKRCIDRLKKEDIQKYASNNNIKLDNNELNLIYSCIKTRWEDIYNNGIEVINEYKNKLKDTTYNKLIELYNNIKRYYKL